MHAVLSLLAILMQLSPTTSTPGATIRGTVLDFDSRPLSNATVWALPEQRMNKPITTIAGDDGHFLLRDLPPGIIYLDASKDSAGHPYSLFSFYIALGEQKPSPTVRSGQQLDNVIIRMGQKVAYLDLAVVDEKNQSVPCNLVFTRPDIPHEGRYSTGFSGQGTVPVPSQPFTFSVISSNYETWQYHAPAERNLISLKPGERKDLIVILHPAENKSAK